MFFYLIIKPIILKSETYIKDSQNLIQICENIKFSKKPLLYSLDVSSLYPSIDPDHAVPIITEFITNYLDNYHISTYGFNG